MVGDAVNLASRLCSEAQAQQIVISEEHYQQMADPGLVVVKKLQQIQVRGKRKPVMTYLVEDVAFKQKSRINSVIEDVINSRSVS